MPHRVTKRLCLLAAAPLLAVTLHAQTAPAPLELGLLTLSTDLSSFTGQTVRITNARIDRILSPRLLIVEPASLPSSQSWWQDNRALVVLPAPSSSPLRRGTVVEIVGEAWSLYEMSLRPDQPVLADLKSRDARHFAYKPVIHADILRTPGGMPMSGVGR